MKTSYLCFALLTLIAALVVPLAAQHTIPQPVTFSIAIYGSKGVVIGTVLRAMRADGSITQITQGLAPGDKFQETIDVSTGYATNVDFGSKTFITFPLSRKYADGASVAPTSCEDAGKMGGFKAVSCAPSAGTFLNASTYKLSSEKRISAQKILYEDVTFLPQYGWIVAENIKRYRDKDGNLLSTDRDVITSIKSGEPDPALFIVPTGFHEVQTATELWTARRLAQGKQPYPAARYAKEDARIAKQKAVGPFYITLNSTTGALKPAPKPSRMWAMATNPSLMWRTIMSRFDSSRERFSSTCSSCSKK